MSLDDTLNKANEQAKYYEKFINLIAAIKRDGEIRDLDLLEDRMKSFPDYVQSVATMEMEMPIARMKFEGEPEKFQAAVKRMDNRRRSAHENAIVGCNVINRVCDMYQQEKMFEIDTKDRYAVADVAQIITNEFYEIGQGEIELKPEIENQLRHDDIEVEKNEVER